AIDARVSGVALDDRLRPHVDAIVDLLGLGDELAATPPRMLVSLLGELRTMALTDVRLLFAASRGLGWRHHEPELLQAAGDVSLGFPEVLASTVAPALDGLVERLAAPTAAFLDVGVGVAAMSIEMARRWPALRIVGIDPWGPAVELARERVREAGLVDRIELRVQAGEQCRDRDAFDLAWVPGVFVPEDAIAAVLDRVHDALRFGGWMLLPIMKTSDDPLAAALSRLRAAMFGGLSLGVTELEALVRARFTTVRTLPSRPGALTTLLAARREA
ncbi:MAG: class I SAM-dependent methyltransferase, partial [Deltaproteobacteria bacterium]|nr:class I SAM-dependent methyltransferase [Nannocystaceae bacterium]